MNDLAEKLRGELYAILGLAAAKAHQAGTLGAERGNGMYGAMLAESFAAIDRLVNKFVAEMTPKPPPPPPVAPSPPQNGQHTNGTTPRPAQPSPPRATPQPTAGPPK